MKLGCAATLLLAEVIFASAQPAFAAAHCDFGVDTGVAFGAYNVLSPSNNTSNGTLVFACKGIGAGTDDVTVTLSTGNSPTYGPRYMLNGPTTQLDYNLFLDPADSIVWGDGTGGTSIYGPTAVTNDQTVTLTIYGMIPAGQDVPAGSYSDSITATINF